MKIGRVLRAPTIIHRALLAMVLLAGAATAGAQGIPPEVESELRRAQIPLEATATYVQEVGSRAAWIAVNAKKPFNPASTMKLLTTAAALDTLGPTYTWKTRVYLAGTVRDEILHGNLVFQGGGDPKFMTENLWQLLRELRAKGIRDIRGDVVLDRSAFELAPFDPAAFDGAPEKPYNAGPDALLLNHKVVKLQFSPDDAGGATHVAVDPPLAGFAVARPPLSDGACNGWQEKLAPEVLAAGMRFGGGYDAACGDKIWFYHAFALGNDQYFGAAFRQLWQDLGGRLQGEVRAGPLPSGARQIAAWVSPSLPEVVHDINKFSNNVMARQLLLTLAMEQRGRPATPEQGVRVVREWLGSKGINAPELVMENGSGLSRQARVSALTMGKLLAAMWRSPRMPEFMASLPVAAYDGSMRNRLKDSSAAGRAHIKTGGLREVRTIAGYVLAASGKRYIVVHFINHPNSAAGRGAQDALLQWVHDNG